MAGIEREIRFQDLKVGKFYKLQDRFELVAPWINGTIQEDIERISRGFYELTYVDDDDGAMKAEFKIPSNMPAITLPAEFTESRTESSRQFIVVSEEALPQKGDTIFLEQVQGTIGEEEELEEGEIKIGGRRKHKQRKTKKNKRKATRKQKKRMTKRR